MWNSFFKEVFKTIPDESFKKPNPGQNIKKPVLNGEWKGGEIYFIDSISGKLATEFTPKNIIKEKVITNIHSILYWVEKNNPQGETPKNPESDPQYRLWEYPVQNWVKYQNIKQENPDDIPKEYDDIHKQEYKPIIKIIQPTKNDVFNKNDTAALNVFASGKFPIKQADFFFKNKYLGSVKLKSEKLEQNIQFFINLSSFNNLEEKEKLEIKIYDKVYNYSEISMFINIISSF